MFVTSITRLKSTICEIYYYKMYNNYYKMYMVLLQNVHPTITECTWYYYKMYKPYYKMYKD